MKTLRPLLCLLLLWMGSASALQPGENAPNFTGTQLDGGKALSLKNLRGKVVYVDFWATWCTPCRISLPLLAQMQSELGPLGLQIVGINTDADANTARRWVAETGVNYPTLRGVPDDTLRAYGVAAMPSAYLIDRTGRVRAVHAGFRASQFGAVRSEIERLLREETR